MIDIHTLLVPQTVQKLAFECPLLVYDLDPISCFEVVTEATLIEAVTRLLVEPFSFPLIFIHQSLIDIAVLKDNDGHS